MVRFYDMIEARTVDASDITLHGVHLGPQSVATVKLAPGANTYPIVLPANAAGRLIATSELFSNAAWKSLATVIVPAGPGQRPVLGNVLKSEKQGIAAGANTFALTADLQPFAGTNTNAPTSDTPASSIQLAVSNCAQACNVFVTLA